MNTRNSLHRANKLSRRHLMLGMIAGTVGVAAQPIGLAHAERPLLPHLRVEDVGTPFGTSAGRRILTQDAATSATTAVHVFPENWQGGGVAHYPSCAEEVYVISGDITLNGRDYLTAGSYLYRPGGIVHGHNEGSKSGCRCLIRTDGLLNFNYIPEPKSGEEYVEIPSDDGRPHILHLRAPDIAGTWQGADQTGYERKILSEDRKTGDTTSLLRFPTGWTGPYIPPPGIALEWLVIDGQVTMSDGTVFKQGSYSYRPASQQQVAFASAEKDTEILLWQLS